VTGSVSTLSLSTPGPHGGDIDRVARALGVAPSSLLDLSASLNPLAPDVTELAGKRLGSLRQYPCADEATRLLADTLGVDVARLLLTNGGAEAISLVAAELGGRVREPEFSLHPRDAGGVTWRSNPHNPTGRLAAPDDVADVWDEAFYPLSTGRWSRGDVALGSSTAVVGSLTKLFNCPGLRLGYVMADPSLIEQVARRQPAWSVGSLALAVLPDLLEHATRDLSSWAAGVTTLRHALVAMLLQYDIEPEPSDANFVLAQGSADLRDRLLTQGVVIRDCTSFGLPHHVRIAVPDAGGLERLALALERATAA
jgi:histidinol-phosphate/aromatic aminotransferase/cobyric acid decarboxylase-like protein